MTRMIVIACVTMLLTSAAMAQQSTATKLLDRGAAVHESTAVGAEGTVVNSTEYYGSGNGDLFAEYGIASFSFDASDFTVPAGSIVDFDYTLTVNDRGFTSGTNFELFLTTDAFDATYSGIEYDNSFINGINLTQFTNISSLGSFSFDPAAAGGTQVTVSPMLTSAQETSLVTQIANNAEFGIIIGAFNPTDDITFTGFDDNFEPGGQPVLSITVGQAAIPEPASASLLGLGLVGCGLIRRRKV